MKLQKSFAILLIVFLVLIISSCNNQPEFKGTFTFVPEKPQPGEEITVLYDPSGTKLENSENVELIAYEYSVDLDKTTGIEMEKLDKGWKGKVKTSDTTKGVLIKFQNSDEIIDNNEGNGYVVHLYNENGEIVPGSVAGLAAAYASWGNYYLDMELNRELALEKFLEEFEAHPDIKKEYLDSYFYTTTRLYPEKKDSIVYAELSVVEEDPASEGDLKLLINWYGKINDTTKENKYKADLNENYPESNLIQRDEYIEIYNEPGSENKIKMLNEFEKKYPESEYISNAYDVVLRDLLKKGEVEKVKTIIDDNPGKPGIYIYYYLSNQLLKDNNDFETALWIAEKGVERSRAELENPSDEQPAHQTKNEWKNRREYYLGLNLYALGYSQLKLDKTENAVRNLEEAVDLMESEDPDVNEVYAEALIKNENFEKAFNKIEGFIKEAKSTSSMKELLKTAFVETKDKSEDFNSYWSELQKTAKKNLKAELKEEMINEPAPGFTLTDLKGNEVSLSDFKDKVVIIDFWATWCGPCISSFPGMQQAVNDFSDDENVKFLFVNTWENVDNKKENAENFISKNNYSFHVLLDYNNKVIEKYKVSGIPTKFIIDGSGNIRYKSVGFGGSTDQLVEELSAMIEMIKS